jgi:hypothetical protein
VIFMNKFLLMLALCVACEATAQDLYPDHHTEAPKKATNWDPKPNPHQLVEVGDSAKVFPSTAVEVHRHNCSNFYGCLCGIGAVSALFITPILDLVTLAAYSAHLAPLDEVDPWKAALVAGGFSSLSAILATCVAVVSNEDPDPRNDFPCFLPLRKVLNPINTASHIAMPILIFTLLFFNNDSALEGKVIIPLVVFNFCCDVFFGYNCLSVSRGLH